MPTQGNSFETIYEVRSDYITRIQKYLSSEGFAESISKAACNMLTERGATIGSAARMIGIDLKNGDTAQNLIKKTCGLRCAEKHPAPRYIQNTQRHKGS
ncbi:MAG: hypothetical protein LRY51_07940 [Geovibrio sp.]|nr:hypothetical protein [Geovibrio sp.]